jgi:CheY-like chemotaxis protein
MLATAEQTILTVCLPDDGPTELPMWRAATAAEALSTVRLAHVDLLLTGLALPDMCPWQFLRRVRAAASAPRWALVASELSEADEVAARALGAVAVLERMPEAADLLALLERARPASATRDSRTTSAQRARTRGATAAAERTAGIATDSLR